MDDARLLEKLRALESLIAGAATEGERDAAGYARDRIRERLSEQSSREPEIELQYSLSNAWSTKLFTALVRRYGLRPYRYPRQRQTTVMVRGPERFLRKTLWPHFVRVDEARDDARRVQGDTRLIGQRNSGSCPRHEAAQHASRRR